MVWGKLVLFVDQKDYVQLKAEQYDEDGYLVNVMNSSVIKENGWCGNGDKVGVDSGRKRGSKDGYDHR